MRYEATSAKPGAEALASPIPPETLSMPIKVAGEATGSLGMAADQPFYSPKGTWFDPAINFRNPEGDALTKEVLALVSAIEGRKRKLRQTDENNRYVRVRHILANGFRCHFHRHPPLVAYSRKADGYKDGPRWLSGPALAQCIDLLESAELLDTRLGKWGEASSLYQIRPGLYGIAEACGVTTHSLTLKLPPERLVRLPERNSGTPLVPFEPSDETLRWTSLLEAYNAFLDHQDVTLETTAFEKTEWVKHWNTRRHNDSPSLVRTERFRTHLYRTFNNGSFGEGGRMYGGWWMSVPKSLRPKITINGEPTVELDFSGCAIRMLYHERDIDYRDDPYELEGITSYSKLAGLKEDYFREGIKAVMQALINDREGQEPERIQLPDGLSFLPRFKRIEVRRMIEEKHQPIADVFSTGAGLRLQRRDSDLALTIITNMRERGMLALPIHDSFITEEKHQDALIYEMRKAYRSEFKYNPIIGIISSNINTQKILI